MVEFVILSQAVSRILVQLVGRVTLRLKDSDDDDIVPVLQELLDLLEGQDLLEGGPDCSIM